MLLYTYVKSHLTSMYILTTLQEEEFTCWESEKGHKEGYLHVCS